MPSFRKSAMEQLPAEKLQELRYEAKTQYYHSHMLDFAMSDVNLEDFIYDHIEAYYQSRKKPTAVTTEPAEPPKKPESKLKRFLQRISLGMKPRHN